MIFEGLLLADVGEHVLVNMLLKNMFGNCVDENFISKNTSMKHNKTGSCWQEEKKWRGWRQSVGEEAMSTYAISIGSPTRSRCKRIPTMYVDVTRHFYNNIACTIYNTCCLRLLPRTRFIIWNWWFVTWTLDSLFALRLELLYWSLA